MKAAQISEYGHADKVQVVDIDKPPVGIGQVLVEVHAASLNPFDTMVREGYVKEAIPSLPVTLGGDISGIVTEIGEGVDGFAAGDKVYGQANVVAGNSGAFAEYAVTAATQLAKAPENISVAEAASLPLVASSAYQALNEHLKLSDGQRIFIHGGSGGIGSIAIQIAKHLGAYVEASVRGENDAHRVKQFGADKVYDSTKQEIDGLSGFDAVFDTVGDDFTKLLSLLKPGGKAVSMIAHADDEKVKELGVTAITQSTHVTTDVLRAICKLVEARVIKPNVGKTFPLEEIVNAFEARESGEYSGKIIVAIK